MNEELFELIQKIDRDKSLLGKIKNKQKKFSDKIVYENIDNQMNRIFYEKY